MRPGTLLFVVFLFVTTACLGQEAAFFRHDSTPGRIEWRDGAPFHKFSDGLVLKRSDHPNVDYRYSGAIDGVVWVEAYPGVLYGKPNSIEARKRYPSAGGARKVYRFYNKERELLKSIVVASTNPFIDSLNNIEWGTPNFETHANPPEEFDPASVKPTAYWTMTDVSVTRKNGFVLIIHNLFPFYRHYRLPMKSVVDVIAPNGRLVASYEANSYIFSPNVSNDGRLLAFVYGYNDDPYLQARKENREVRIVDLHSKRGLCRFAPSKKKILLGLNDSLPGVFQVLYRHKTKAFKDAAIVLDLIDLNSRKRYYKEFPRTEKGIPEKWWEGSEELKRLLNNHDFQITLF